MIFSDFYKGPRSPLAKLRPHLHLQQQTPLHTNQTATEMDGNAPEWCRDEYADLLSKDKLKVKNAVKRYLASKVRNDWVFTWPPADNIERPISPPTTEEDEETPKPTATTPPTGLDGTTQLQDETNEDPGYQADDGGDSDPAEEDLPVAEPDHDGASIYSVISEDPIHYQALKEWDSDMPVDDQNEASPTHEDYKTMSKAERDALKRRALREELKYNEGLACFEARRKAWTDARTVRLRTKPGVGTPISPTRSPRRFFFRRSISGPSSQGQPQSAISVSISEASPDKESHKSHDRDSTSSVSQNSNLSSYPVATIVPLAPPILPPTNPLRASINPAHYLQLYDKLIVNSLTPSCPVNLSDMISALVAGWKRDGEWPPRSTIPIDPLPMSLVAATKARKRSSFAGTNESGLSTRRLSLTGLLSRDKDGTGKGMRQSIQRALGIGTSVDTPVTSHKLNV